MPCYDSRDDDKDWGEILERLDRATRVACELARYIREVVGQPLASSTISRDSRRWVQEHDVADRRRLAAEEKEKQRKHKKAQALSKLTSEERKLLGL